jgi:hypothetical protein
MGVGEQAACCGRRDLIRHSAWAEGHIALPQPAPHMFTSSPQSARGDCLILGHFESLPDLWFVQMSVSIRCFSVLCWDTIGQNLGF